MAFWELIINNQILAVLSTSSMQLNQSLGENMGRNVRHHRLYFELFD